MNRKITRSRAKLAGKATKILDSRTLKFSHKRLSELLTEGLSVLDVGCGTGTITKGISEIVGPSGQVVGVDNNPALIERAQELYNHIPGLFFEVGDIYHLKYHDRFDIVTSARVLQWLSNPRKALLVMKSVMKPGGQLLILDYNHEKIAWEPDVPLSMKRFYSAFLKWRSDAGMSNIIADQLPEFFEEVGMENITVSSQHEKVIRQDKDFLKRMDIWTDVVASRGLQMVEDGYITEEERSITEKEYRNWVKHSAKSQMMYLLAIEGIK